jgi:hypothetical protein
MLFSNSINFSKNYSILPYKIHFIPILVGRLIWTYKLQSPCPNNILNDTENKYRDIIPRILLSSNILIKKAIVHYQITQYTEEWDSRETYIRSSSWKCS